jgi:hypothetical protein
LYSEKQLLARAQEFTHANGAKGRFLQPMEGMLCRLGFAITVAATLSWMGRSESARNAPNTVEIIAQLVAVLALFATMHTKHTLQILGQWMYALCGYANRAIYLMNQADLIAAHAAQKQARSSIRTWIVHLAVTSAVYTVPGTPLKSCSNCGSPLQIRN